MGFHRVKPSYKPGLTEDMRKKRLQWAQDHAHWTLEDWKKVIWTDETAVVLGSRRGSFRVWRTANQRYDSTVVRPRWNGSMEFMFWGAFTYDRKGPFHCWAPETAAEKKAAEKDLAKRNKENEPILKEQWELETGMRRIGLRNKPGKKPQWRFTEKTGKLTRNGKGGIDCIVIK